MPDKLHVQPRRPYSVLRGMDAASSLTDSRFNVVPYCILLSPAVLSPCCHQAGALRWRLSGHDALVVLPLGSWTLCVQEHSMVVSLGGTFKYAMTMDEYRPGDLLYSRFAKGAIARSSSLCLRPTSWPHCVGRRSVDEA